MNLGRPATNRMHLQMSRSRLLILTLMAVVVVACAGVYSTNRATQREADSPDSTSLVFRRP